MRNRRCVWAGLAALAIGGMGCSTQLYEGARRPASEIGKIGSASSVEMIAIDGVKVNGGSYGSYELLPGPHDITFRGHLGGNFLFFRVAEQTSSHIQSCILVEPGTRYRVTAVPDDYRWETRIEERISGRDALGCEESSSIARSNRPDARVMLDGSAGRAVLAKTPHPGTGPEFLFGYEYGGENLLTAIMSDGSKQTLKAGSGAFLGFGLALSPVWIGDSFGMGLATRLGVKFDQVGGSNATIEKVSYPFSLGPRLYARMDPEWYLSFGGGAHKELSPSLSGTGEVQGGVDFASPWGGYGELSVLSFPTWHTVLGLAVRYTRMSLQLGGDSIRADSFGVSFFYQPNP